MESSNRIEACIDLKNEARYLSRLSHPNIIEIYGFGQKDGNLLEPFLLFERINCTLQTQCRDWKEVHKGMKRRSALNKNKRAFLWNERLDVAKDLAHAMAYLHRFNIVFRDMKPENCGFDMNGVLKLFDFGLATRLTSDKRIALNQYNLTGNTGTRRYMAPEVYQCMPYGKPADVYSFGIILWGLMSLKQAFKGETSESHARKVYGRSNYRPRIKKHWPQMIQQLIRDCWSADASKRPTFEVIQLCLRESRLD